MFRYKWIGFMLAVSAMFQNIGFDPRKDGFEKGKKEYRIKKVAKIDFLESSGVMSETPNEFWTHNDSGGDAALYKFNIEGEPVDTRKYEGLKNKDWEDVTTDDQGNIYIGEFGNNSNRRKDLKIYKISRDQEVDTITFRYPDQVSFPPKEDDKNFDCEGFFWSNSDLYLFSKNRGRPIVKAYRLTDQPGTQVANLLDSIHIKRMVTAADIHPDETEFSLLSYGMVYTFQWTNPDKPFSTPLKATKFTKGGQSEGIAYDSNGDMLISNEAGKIYRSRRRKN